MADFQSKLGTIRGLGAKVVAMSTDSEEDARGTVDDLDIDYPVGYDLDRDAVSEAIGAYTNDDPPHLQPADFVLSPDGTIALAVYSSGAVGRLHADEAVEEIEFLQKGND